MSYAQSIIQVRDGNGTLQSIGMLTGTWDAGTAQIQAMILAPASYESITSSGLVLVKNTPGILLAIVNMDPNAAQPYQITTYDTDTGTATGNIVSNVLNLAAGAPVDSIPSQGISCNSGITIDLAGTPTLQINVYYL